MPNIDLKNLLTNTAIDIIEITRDAFLLLDNNLEVVFANNSFYNIFKVNSQDTINKKIYEIGNKQWDIPELKIFLEETLSKKQEFHNYKVSHNFPEIGEKVMLLNGKRMQIENNTNLTLLVISDITDREKDINILKKSYASIERMNSFMVGREIKMSELKNEIEILKKTISDSIKK